MVTAYGVLLPVLQPVRHREVQTTSRRAFDPHDKPLHFRLYRGPHNHPRIYKIVACDVGLEVLQNNMHADLDRRSYMSRETRMYLLLEAAIFRINLFSFCL